MVCDTASVTGDTLWEFKHGMNTGGLSPQNYLSVNFRLITYTTINPMATGSTKDKIPWLIL